MVEDDGAQVAMAVVAGNRAMLLKIDAAVLHRLGKPIQRHRLATTSLRQLRKQTRPAFGSRLQVPIRAEGGGNAPGERLVVDQSSVPIKIVAGVIGRRDEGDVEGVHESARPKVRLGNPLSDGVVDAISVLRARTFSNAKNADKLVDQPVAHCRAGKITPVLTQNPKGLSVVCLAHGLASDPQVLEINTIGMQQAIYIVVRSDKEARRVREGHVIGDP